MFTVGRKPRYADGSASRNIFRLDNEYVLLIVPCKRVVYLVHSDSVCVVVYGYIHGATNGKLDSDACPAASREIVNNKLV